MMTMVNNFANMYADAYTEMAGWITAHPVFTTVSVIAMLGLAGYCTAVAINSLLKA